MPFDVEWIEFGWPLSPNGQPEGRWGRDVDFVAWSRAFEKLDAGGRRRFTPAGGLCRPGLTTAGWGPWPARFRAALVLTYDAGVAGLLGRGLVLALIEERFEPGGLRAFRRSVHYLLPEEWADSPQPAALAAACRRILAHTTSAAGLMRDQPALQVPWDPAAPQVLPRLSAPAEPHARGGAFGMEDSAEPALVLPALLTRALDDGRARGTSPRAVLASGLGAAIGPGEHELCYWVPCSRIRLPEGWTRQVPVVGSDQRQPVSAPLSAQAGSPPGVPATSAGTSTVRGAAYGRGRVAPVALLTGGIVFALVWLVIVRMLPRWQAAPVTDIEASATDRCERWPEYPGGGPRSDGGGEEPAALLRIVNPVDMRFGLAAFGPVQRRALATVDQWKIEEMRRCFGSLAVVGFSGAPSCQAADRDAGERASSLQALLSAEQCGGQPIIVGGRRSAFADVPASSPLAAVVLILPVQRTAGYLADSQVPCPPPPPAR